ncbi:hypothetical protein [Absidia glauca]|uniref:VASt domain-containing protein n=1 Tax=Absidia glauca TaxID=4829 RepID=A0A163LTL9_ABSGL|nr:hypothetical protein [Absidia glauca]
MRHRRLHSNTISGDRPPAIDTTIRPSMLRRNSEGSPGLPPEIDICAATPLGTEASKEQQQEPHLSLDHFPSTAHHKVSSHGNLTLNDDKHGDPKKTSSSQSLPTPVAAPEVSSSNNHTLRIPMQAKKTRSRSSSQSTTGSHTKPRPRITSMASGDGGGARSRQASESEGNSNGVPASTTLKLSSSRRGSTVTEDWNSEGEQSMVAGSIATAVRMDSVSDKRNQEFHALFRSVPEDDMLIEDYGCALQKEILVQGRIYISENHLCFNANIFGWVTNHFFASFLSRDQAFDLMVDVWRYSRPLTNKPTDSNTDDTSTSQLEEDGEVDDEYEEDTSDMDSDYTYSGTETEEEDNHHTSLAPSLPPPSASKKVSKNDSLRRRAFSEGAKNIDSAISSSSNTRTPSPSLPTNDNHKPLQPTPLAQAVVSSSPPPLPSSQQQSTPVKQTIEKTECQCGQNGQHYPNTVFDHVYKGTLESIYKLLYTGGFMKKFLIETEKSTDVSIGEWSVSDETKQQVRKVSYIKQLNGSIGPKQTQCIQTEEVIHSDMMESVTVLTTTQTPDVPVGGSFSVKTRTCLTWAGFGKVRILVTVLVDFTKTSWLKSTIEKASIDGQVTFYKHLDVAVQQYIKQHPSEFLLDAKNQEGRRKKGKRRHRKHKKDHSNANQKDESINSSSNITYGGSISAVMQVLDVVMEVLKHAWDSSPFSSLGNGTFTISHLTILCLLMMVFVNVYIACKMKGVENRLHSMADHGNLSPNQPQQTQYYGIKDPDSMERMYRDELWAWLKTLDVDQEDRITNATTTSPYDSDSPTGSVLDPPHIGMPQHEAKTILDHDLLELVKMVRRAEQNIGQASRAMERQRQKIENNLLANAAPPSNN